jgi:hypothetical protein
MARVVLFLLVLVFASSAKAQVVTTLTEPTYLAVTTNPTPGGGGGLCGPPYCVDPQQGIPLSYFATGASVTNQINSEIGAINSQMNSQLSRAFQLAAIGASMGDAIPNPGDRFALRLNTAGFSGQAGGSVGFSYALNNTARISINYGQGSSISVVSGGVNFSFH